LSAPANDEGAVSESEVDNVLSRAETEASAVDVGPNLNLYGFADFSVTHQFNDRSGVQGLLFGESPNFSVGNLNLYASADLTKGWRSLFEVRFTYLPNGSLNPKTVQREATIASDYAAFGQTMRWGTIEIERVWLEYSLHSVLTIRAGQWLTPVGIWNVDHGTPTIIPVNRPNVMVAGLFPERQTGFEIYGNILLGQATLGYHLTVSNGRGNIDDYADLDKNKAVGGRLYLSVMAVGTLTLGVSGYLGRATDAGLAFDPTGTEIPFVKKISTQYDEMSYAADLLWEWEELHFQGEMLFQEMAFTDVGRPAPALPLASPGLIPNNRRSGGYLLVGFRFPWLGLMPFVMAEYVYHGSASLMTAGGTRGTVAFCGGLNLRPVPSVTLKAQYLHAALEALAATGGKDNALDTFSATAAWSF
jgi:hypothetical protein